jgi:hypothetical protein
MDFKSLSLCENLELVLIVLTDHPDPVHGQNGKRFSICGDSWFPLVRYGDRYSREEYVRYLYRLIVLQGQICKM